MPDPTPPPETDVEKLAEALKEESETVGAVLSLNPTPFQLEQASNFITTTVPRAVDKLLQHIETLARERDEARGLLDDIADDDDEERRLRQAAEAKLTEAERFIEHMDMKYRYDEWKGAEHGR